MLERCGIDTTRPLLTQVSRFGNWKNPWQVIDVYRLVKQELPIVQVALVGALEAADDIKAVEILKDVQEKAGSDPHIHLLADPHMTGSGPLAQARRTSSRACQETLLATHDGLGVSRGAREGLWNALDR